MSPVWSLCSCRSVPVRNDGGMKPAKRGIADAELQSPGASEGGLVWRSWWVVPCEVGLAAAHNAARNHRLRSPLTEASMASSEHVGTMTSVEEMPELRGAA